MKRKSLRFIGVMLLTGMLAAAVPAAAAADEGDAVEVVDEAEEEVDTEGYDETVDSGDFAEDVEETPAFTGDEFEDAAYDDAAVEDGSEAVFEEGAEDGAAAVTEEEAVEVTEETENETAETEEDAGQTDETAETEENTEQTVTDGGEIVWQDMTGEEVVEETTEQAAEVTQEETVSADAGLLWTYQYVGVPNIYKQTMCDWLNAYHAGSEPSGTGMIPALSVSKIDDSDANDIRIYGRFLISDYALSGTTLVDRRDELLVGCFHLQKVSDTEYLVTMMETLDPNDIAGTAKVLAAGDGQLESELLSGKIKAELRTKYIKDFVEAYSIGADRYQDGSGTIRPIGRTDRNSPSWISRTVAAQLVDQIVTVGQTSGSNAVLQMHVKQDDGSWLCVLDVPALIGRNGLGKTCEGDGRTPVGDFGFAEAFGTDEDPGALMKYTKCDDSWYFVSDSNSERYNKLVSVNEFNAFDQTMSERIVDYPDTYRFALSISYNEEAVPYLGSAIFLNCTPPESFSTGGCIAVPADAMAYLIRNLKSDARILIDTEENLKTQYLTAKARKLLADNAAASAETAAAPAQEQEAPQEGAPEEIVTETQVQEDVGTEVGNADEDETFETAVITTETVTESQTVPEDGEVYEEVIEAEE